MLTRKISNIEELFPALYEIGEHKNWLPIELRGWVNVLGLYVQLRNIQTFTTTIESLVAGGKYIGYFSATCEYPIDSNMSEAMIDNLSEIMVAPMFGDFTHWKIKKFDQQVWERRFAHLVEPTSEIVWYIFLRDNNNLMKTSGSKNDIDKFKTQSLPKLVNAVEHFQSTGEWIGLYENKCMSCGKNVSWWPYSHFEPCPHCSGKIRD